MTRINLIDPHELTDQHLFAEWREIKMVPAALKRSLRTKTPQSVLKSIPKEFTLNKGHVLFFYNKMQYLSERYDQLSKELMLRGYRKDLDWNPFSDYCETIPSMFFGNYVPTPNAIIIIKSRIKERIDSKPNWYKYYSKPIVESKAC
ncbi:Pyrimidine dimer DNA glycosylase [uncultured Caudovirales phage]|uniref:Pyrimidine dimer DNA glycosylase n=1 Tax=uncultured Caudovirales phage TaxID=2100421 RepID=A0A6J5L436_9CAUD|nr:Pyrimidine dimer DNA glycosylase [uncultured Caudovirales phage]